MLWVTMASTGSACSGDAPRDFHLSPSIEDSGSRFSTSVEKCPLCYYNRGTFYCKQCIQEGSFIHSNNHYAERYRNEKHRHFIIVSSLDADELCWIYNLKRTDSLWFCSDHVHFYLQPLFLGAYYLPFIFVVT